MDQPQLQPLIEQAILASTRAYAPYSRFQVGAALRLANGEIVLGCNVENASYGLTTCAERTALGAAIAGGHRDFAAMAIYVATDEFVSPCGACRQVLLELAPDLPIWLVNRARRTMQVTPRQLLPLAFEARHLADLNG